MPDGNLPPPPPDLLARSSLFLDFDGTLTPIVDRPDAVVVDEQLRTLLRTLADARPGRVAVVSGRSVAQLDDMLGPVAHALALAGSHGAELRMAGAGTVPVQQPASLGKVAASFTAFTAARTGTMTEMKALGAALHYRLAPEHEADAHALAERLAGEHGLTLQRGKMVVELRAAGDKGRAITAMMATPEMAGTVPVVLGDDVTDEDAFAAAATLGGAGVLVGEARETAATYRLPDVPAVHRWLAEALAA
jgi:trehalose 6-phosphate phosphatase